MQHAGTVRVRGRGVDNNGAGAQLRSKLPDHDFDDIGIWQAQEDQLHALTCNVL
jgi:hypothetical protein